MVCLWSFTAASQNSNIELSTDSNDQRIEFSIQSESEEVSICNFTPGDRYVISVSANKNADCNVVIGEFSDKNQARNFLIINPKESCQSFFVHSACKSGLILSISKKDNTEKASTDEKMMPTNIEVTHNNNAVSLIQDVFIGGDCFEVSNVIFSGSNGQIGTFNNGTASINIEEGVIISTGDINNTPGPNSSPSISTSYALTGADSDLDAISGGGTLYDIANIEFDFTPTEDQISFEYAFASDEYCEYAGTTFNDVFGFFISGPGINGPYSNGSENIAIVPGSGANVAINTVNHLSNVAYYLDNSLDAEEAACMSGAPVAENDIEFDGFTTVLTAVANVIPCETYHIKLVIADRGDAIYDSAVFLKANSFGGEAEVNITSEISGNAAGAMAGYEGCSDALITFTRINNDLSEDLIINYTISDQSTATAGVDYEALPPFVTIPAGQQSLTLTIPIYLDVITEGMENIIIELQHACSCDASLVEIQIFEPPPLEVGLQPFDVCQGQTATLTPIVTGGIPPYTFSWNNGSTAESIDVLIDDVTTYSVTVSDDCHSGEGVTFEITPSYNNATIEGQGSICSGNGETAELLLTFTGDAPWSVTYTVDGVPNTISGITSNPYTLVVDETGNYQLLEVTSADGCGFQLSGQAVVHESNIDFNATVTPASCYGEFDATALINVTEGTAPFTYDWGIGPTNDPYVAGIPAGIYFVTVTDALGCVGQNVIELEEPMPLQGGVNYAVDIDCNTAEGIVSLVAAGGTQPYSFYWPDGQNSSFRNDLEVGNYEVTVIDDNGCQTILETSIADNADFPLAATVVQGELNCYESEVSISAEGSSTQNVYYQWFAPNGSVLPGTGPYIEVEEPGTYTLWVTGIDNQCTTEAQAEVTINEIPPLAEAGTGDTLDCAVTEIWLSGTVEGQLPNVSYNWMSEEGNIISGDDNMEVMVNAPGVYTLTVMNVENGCTASDEVYVDENFDLPAVSLQNEQPLTCTIDEVMVTSIGSSVGSNYNYFWTTENGNITSSPDSFQISVNEPGNYQLLIIDDSNGCMDSLSFPVQLDTLAPVANAGENLELDCQGTILVLDGAGSTTGDSIIYEWTTSNGAILSGEQSLNAETVEAGIYTLTVTNQENGCLATDQVEIFNSSGSLPIEAFVQDELNCINSTIELNGNVLVGNENYTVLWTSSDGNSINSPEELNIEVDAPGVYSLQVTNSDNGCISNASVEVIQNIQPPLADAGGDQIINCYAEFTTLDATGSDYGDEIHIQWLNPDGSPPENDSAIYLETPLSGIFTLTVLNTENGCSSTDHVEVLTDFDDPISFAGVDRVINCAQDSVLLGGYANSGTDPYEFQWVYLDTDEVVSTTSLGNYVEHPGNYELSVMNLVNGCIAVDTVNVGFDLEAPTAEAEANDVLNCYNEMISLTANGSSQGAEFSYRWIFTETGQNISYTQNHQATSPGNYQLIVTNDENHCTDTTMILVEQDIELPTAFIEEPEDITCEELSVALTTTGTSSGTDFTYNWILPDSSSINMQDSPEIEAVSIGTYTLQVLDVSNGCETEYSVEVTSQDVLPVSEAGPPQILNCYSTEVALDPAGSSQNGNYVYSWQQNGEPLTQSDNTEPLMVTEPGIYEFLVTDLDNGCSSVDMVMVEENIEEPVAKAGPEMSLDCINEQLFLDGTESSIGNVAYSWSTEFGSILEGDSLLTPLINEAGAYFLTVINLENGCLASDSVMIAIDTVAPEIIMEPAELLTCLTQEVTLEGSSDGNHEYSWFNIENELLLTTSDLVVQQPGTYYFQVNNPENGCQSMASISVDQNIEVPVAEAGGEATLNCSVTTLALNGLESSSDCSYLWTTIDGTILSGNYGLTPQISAPGTYTLAVTDNLNGCSSVDEVTVNIDIEDPVVSAAAEGELNCMITEVELEGFIDEQTNGLEYQWINLQTGQIVNFGSLNLSVSQPGNYEFYVLNTTNGCDNNSVIEVVQNIENPVADAGEAADLTCMIPNLTLQGSVISEEPDDYSFTWSGPDGGIIANGNSPYPIIVQPGTYTLYVTNENNGCTGIDQVEVAQIMPSEIEVNVEQPLCHGDPAYVDITTVEGGAPPYVYSINGGSTFVQNEEFTLLSPGWHLIVVQDANGCELSEGIEMIDIPEMEIELDPLTTIKLGEDYQINATVNIPNSQIQSISWTPSETLSCADCLYPLASPQQTTDYLLEVVNENGCMDEAKIRLIVDERPEVFIPNVFSPNSDGLNEVFHIFAKVDAVKTVKSLQIFTRWGELVYQAFDFPPNDPQYGWDGYHRGEPVNSNVFVYWTEIELINGEKVIMKGDVTVIY